ncbi:DUF6324 family protein, partial [Pseudomonas chlororaphis]|uniref:DUF6324 family protein n=1 Tax=Pseudomonas chlororaphis TaxID=587753 RepID=UPI0038B6D9EA
MRSVTPLLPRCKPVLPGKFMQATETHHRRMTIISINSQSDIAANLQVGPTDQGMVRIYLQADGIDLPLDFDPEEATEIAEELLAAAEAAREMGKTDGKPKKP